MIAFSCTHCGAQLQVKESLAGKMGPCPSCSRAVQIPGAGASSRPGSAVGSGKKSGRRAGGDPTVHPSAAEDTASPLPKLAPPREYPFLAPAEGPDELGRLGRYRVLKVLGTGAMGVVFQAEDLDLGRPVALKVMKPSLASYPDFHRRFLREARLAASIDHEHVVATYQVGEDNGLPYLSMKLLQGETMEERLNRSGGRLPVPQVLRIGREIAEGLAAAHEQGLVHRDIKPANVWLERDRDRVKIVDFGLARGIGADAGFTQAGAVIGTPAYMAPEQANSEEVDGRCDLFSLGAVLYRACTGRLPFGGKDTLSVLKALATRDPDPPHQLVPSVPKALSDLVMRLLAKERDRRPASGREVVEALEAIERGEAPAAPPAEEAPARRAPAKEAAPPAAPAEEAEAPRKAPKKARPPASRKKRRREAKRDWGRVILVAALVLLAVALLVLVLGVIRHATRSHAAASHSQEGRYSFRDRGAGSSPASSRSRFLNFTGS